MNRLKALKVIIVKHDFLILYYKINNLYSALYFVPYLTLKGNQMIKKITVTIIFTLIFINLAFAIDVESKTNTLGKTITLTEITPISQILDNPQEFLGDTVLVSGTVIDVCKKRGCWMEIASDSAFQSIKVKVKDGEIVFPLSAKESTALVEGVVEQLVFTKKEVIKMEKHHAEEQGIEFDPATIIEGKTIYRIRGIGAQITE